ncbi:MAG: rhodanese-like domain-containing protein [Clostridia bacterium]
MKEGITMFDDIKKIIFGNNGQKGISSLFNFTHNRSCRPTYKLVSFETAKELILNLKVILLDVRTEKEFEIMHIKNAINIPVNEIEARIFTIAPEKNIMVYCSTGTRSKTAIQYLNNLGYNNIYIWEYSALATFPYKDMLVYRKNEELK